MDRQTGRKHRTKTFTGCWTCRRRHVKCDERRPHCQRCLRAKVDCGGYDIRLTWGRPASQLTSKSEKISKKNDPSSDSHQPVIPSSHQGTYVTPTTTSPEDPELDATNSSQTDCSVSEIRSLAVYRSEDDRSSIREIEDPRAHFHQALEHFETDLTSELAVLDSLTDLRNDRSRGLLGTGTTLAGIDPLLIEPSLPAPEGPCNESQSTCITLSHLEILPELPLQRELLEHWTLHLVDAILPIPHHDNPFRWLITPIALAGAQASYDSFAPSTATFHFLCATSAYHLGRLRSDERLINISLYHHNQGLRHLRETITFTEKNLYVSVLAALTMCLMHETLTVGTPFWRVHIRGAREWLCRIDPSVWSKSRTLSISYQMFFGLVSLIQLQVPMSEAIEDNFRLEFHDPGQYYCIDTLYGISRPTFDVLRTVTALRMRQQHVPISLKELDLLEMEMYLSAPPSPEVIQGAETRMMIYHQSYMFFYSFLIYMKRSFRQVPVSEVQTLVEKVFVHLEDMLNSNTRPYSPSVWPIAIAAFETWEPAIHSRVLSLLDRLRTHAQFDVWPTLGSLAATIWRTRRSDYDHNMKDLPWDKLLQEQVGSPEILLC